MSDPSADPCTSPYAWALAHGVVLSAAPLSDRDRCERWRIEATTPDGTLGIELATDGSFTPDPFDCLFGVWRWEQPGNAELAAVVNVLGPAAVADLALLLDL